MKRHHLIAVVLTIGFAAAPAAAQDRVVQMAAACAPRAASMPPGAAALRVIGAQDTVPKALYGSRDLLIISAGTSSGIQLGQQFFIRRPTLSQDRMVNGMHAVNTTGWLRIVAANETTAIGLVDFACAGIEIGDYLETYAEPELPAGADKRDSAGQLDFTATARLLFGEDGRRTEGTGRFMVSDAGSAKGSMPGSRFAIYRDLEQPGVPLAFVGEAIAVFSDNDTSVVRITFARDAVRTGDLLVPRRQ
jgi:hypothetical protein